jgi:hypothetical protein
MDSERQLKTARVLISLYFAKGPISKTTTQLSTQVKSYYKIRKSLRKYIVSRQNVLEGLENYVTYCSEIIKPICHQ